jgi:DNA-binding GntR family transcriptional regulator
VQTFGGGADVGYVIGMKLSDQLREQIEERIVVGEYAPGYRLDEVEIAKAFGVSRTPIREALIQLASAGLVESRPRRGSVVAEVTPRRLQEMFEVMAELEAFCARLAAARATDQERQALVSAHEACQRALKVKDPDAFYRLNEKFHLALYAACGNAFLTEQATQLQRRVRPYRRLQLRLPGRLKSAFGEHAEVVDAIVRRDSAAAAAKVRAHVEVQGQLFADLVALTANTRRRGEGGAAPRSRPPR